MCLSFLLFEVKLIGLFSYLSKGQCCYQHYNNKDKDKDALWASRNLFFI